jgi:transglutaminase-like putative cysteine protease
MMRMRISHVSRYRYDQPVAVSFNEARLSPLATAFQQPLESVVRIEPATWQHRYVDYWGTRVQVFEVQRSHRELVVEANSLVETNAALIPAPDLTIGWAELRTDDLRSEYAEYLAPTPATQPAADLAELTAQADEFAASLPPHEAALALCDFVHTEMTYEPGSTGVGTVAAEAWSARAGVCQDYAHIVLGALRHIGLPARYVSGYLHPDSEPALGEAADGESHAWVEWWLGEWHGHDPTNNSAAGERHVLVGRGRDYSDVPPIKGIIAGPASTSQLSVDVDLTRLS